MTTPRPDPDEGHGRLMTVPDPSISELPSALDHADDLLERLPAAPPVFCDYDGTLTPIVDDPDRAVLDEDMRAALARLAAVVPLAIVSGRDVVDVRGKVGIDGIFYAGSHGFDVVHPSGERTAHPDAEPVLPSLDAAERGLARAVRAIPGCRVERKRFAVAVHYRLVDPDRHDDVRSAFQAVAADHADLRPSDGKMVRELRPDLDWHKGKAVLYLLDVLGLDGADVAPLYLGDDLTDEDVFRELPPEGVGIVVQGGGHPTAADYQLPDTDAVGTFLERLAMHLETAR